MRVSSWSYRSFCLYHRTWTLYSHMHVQLTSIPLSQWFGPHKALATGIVGGAAGFGGAVSSIIARVMLDRIGTMPFRNTMLIFFGMDLVVWSCGWYLIEERVKRTGSFRRDLRKLWRKVRGLSGKRSPLLAEKETASTAMADVALAQTPRGWQKSSMTPAKLLPEERVGFLQGLERSSVFWCLIISVFISTL